MSQFAIGAIDGTGTTRFMIGPLGIHAQQTHNDAWMYPIMDGLGNVRGVVENGAQIESRQYSPNGQYEPPLSSGTRHTPFGFGGGQDDPSGLNYLFTSYYHPGIGAPLQSGVLSSVASTLQSGLSSVLNWCGQGWQQFLRNNDAMRDVIVAPNTPWWLRIATFDAGFYYNFEWYLGHAMLAAGIGMLGVAAYGAAGAAYVEAQIGASSWLAAHSTVSTALAAAYELTQIGALTYGISYPIRYALGGVSAQEQNLLGEFITTNQIAPFVPSFGKFLGVRHLDEGWEYLSYVRPETGFRVGTLRTINGERGFFVGNYAFAFDYSLHIVASSPIVVPVPISEFGLSPIESTPAGLVSSDVVRWVSLAGLTLVAGEMNQGVHFYPYAIRLAERYPDMHVIGTSFGNGGDIQNDISSPILNRLPNLRLLNNVNATRLLEGSITGSMQPTNIVFNGAAALGARSWKQKLYLSGNLVDDVLLSATDVLRPGGFVRFSSSGGMPAYNRLLQNSMQKWIGKPPTPPAWLGRYQILEPKLFLADPFGDPMYRPITNEGDEFTPQRPLELFLYRFLG